MEQPFRLDEVQVRKMLECSHRGCRLCSAWVRRWRIRDPYPRGCRRDPGE